MKRKKLTATLELESLFGEEVTDDEIRENIENGLVIYFTDDGSAGKLSNSIISLESIDKIEDAE